jgi:hypothetical protein
MYCWQVRDFVYSVKDEVICDLQNCHLSDSSWKDSVVPGAVENGNRRVVLGPGLDQALDLPDGAVR